MLYGCIICFFVFFFKQKTAYEMRISDWSSDVCSSDLETLIVEVKSCVADFRADRKWIEYLPYCDLFYFAVPDGFPRELLPEDCGVMVADGYGAAILRPAPRLAMNADRKSVV